MSYGTYLYPKISDFTEICDLSKEDLITNIDAEVRYRANKFNEFRALAFCTPYNTFGDKAYDRIRDLVSQYFEEYVESYNSNFNLSTVLDLKEQSETFKEGDTYEDGTPKRVYLFYNRFTYSSKEEALYLIEENTQELFKIKYKLLGYALATPIDITPRDQEQYSDGHEEPIMFLEREFDYLEEALEECLRAINVAKLTIKYWDGHEEG